MIKPISRQIIRYLSISCMLILFFSCGNNSIIINENLVFRYNEYANINTLDPAFSRTLQDNSVCN
ncbi:MAG: ABC transporter substrate-binding protein, partial [Algibacter sp.]